ncbi:MAG TPA: hypothetical protein PLX69_20030 [Leptospiraceae bacterium]|nr:hypothetical protein [Leptospiraceae bacterium]HRG76858.1 hypothetical protein [Leptospiraceae bacterium]
MRFILIACLLYAGSLFSEEKAILEIRKYYQKTEQNLKTYTQAKIDYTHKKSHVDETDLLDEEIYFFSNKKEIVKIVGDIVFDCSGSVNELTYKNKELIFVYSYKWSGCNREGKSDESRYYFQNHKLIQWKVGEEEVAKLKWNQKEKELLKLSVFYLKQFPK